MKVIVTGATGFTGLHLLRHFAAGPGETTVIGLSRRPELPAAFQDLAESAHLLPYPATVSELADLIARIQPDALVHLAGYTNPGKSFQEPLAAWEGNWRLTFDLLEAVRQSRVTPRILIVSSAAVYGETRELITEATVLSPLSPYGSSKAAAELHAYQVHHATQLPIIRVRTFNLCGPALPPTFALGEFTRQLVNIKRGAAPAVLRVGNLAAERDYLDVRDVVRAYALLLDRGGAGEVYNLARGETRTMSWCLDRLRSCSGIEVEIEEDRARLRPAETQRTLVDVAKLRQTTGWQPQICLEDALQEQFAHAWRWQVPS